MIDWETYARMPEADLAQQDVAAVNLACAIGLPGSERIDVPGCLGVLANLADLARRYTAHMADDFRSRPERYEYSLAKFRITCLTTAVGRHGGIRYDEAKKNLGADDPYDLDDGFVHAAIQGPGGTCGTLPIVLASVGRRLGYPVQLVAAKAHLFARWDDPSTGERFNIAWNGEGWTDHPDDYYRLWPIPIAPREEIAIGYLRSLSPRKELASFIGKRAALLRDHGDFRAALACLAVAADLDTTNEVFPQITQAFVLEWEAKLKQAQPIGFPNVQPLVLPSNRRWPMMSMDLENRVRLLEAVEDVLQQPAMGRDWWYPPWA